MSTLIVTGAASGIGRATAIRARANGWTVLAVDRNRIGLGRLDRETGVPGVVCDVTSDAEVADLFAGQERCPDALVHCAGIYPVVPSRDMTPAEFRHCLEINTVSSFRVCRAYGTALIAAGRAGSVVLMSSIAARIGDGDEPAAGYNASKGAIEALTAQLATEWGPSGVRVNAVAPGVIDTPMLRLLDEPDRGNAFLSSRVPLRRLGTADEVAAACLFLAGPDASYITGTVLTVDGGVSAC